MTQDELVKELSYDKKTGLFTWRKNKKGRRNGLSVTQTIVAGYSYLSLNYKRYSCHRLAFLYEYGYMPEQVDHKNRNRSDNRIENLRASDGFHNHKNMPLDKRNKSGFTGVNWMKNRKKWRARIFVNKKEISLGMHINKEDAVEARRLANIKYGFDENHGVMI